MPLVCKHSSCIWCIKKSAFDLAFWVLRFIWLPQSRRSSRNKTCIWNILFTSWKGRAYIPLAVLHAFQAIAQYPRNRGWEDTGGAGLLIWRALFSWAPMCLSEHAWCLPGWQPLALQTRAVASLLGETFCLKGSGLLKGCWVTKWAGWTSSLTTCSTHFQYLILVCLSINCRKGVVLWR